MRKLILLSVLIMLLGAVSSKAITPIICIGVKNIAPDSLNDYTGKYKMLQNGEMFYVTVTNVDGALIATPSWNSNKLKFNHIKGDYFIVSGLEWSVKYVRDKDNSILEMIVSGTDHWQKIKQ